MKSARAPALLTGTPLTELPALRARIDELDLGILRLIEERGRVVEQVFEFKRSRAIPVLDEVRERQLLKRLRRLHQGPHAWEDVERVFRLLLEISRSLAQ